MNKQTHESLQELVKSIFNDSNEVNRIKNKANNKLGATRSFPVNVGHQLGNPKVANCPEHFLNLVKPFKTSLALCLLKSDVSDQKNQNCKVRLGQTRSCPCYDKNLPMCFNRTTNSTELVLPSNNNSNIFFFKLESNKQDKYKVEVITKEPLAEPLSCKSIINKTDGCSRQSLCTSCLYNTKDVVSFCTCFWCLEALCYHCVTKDDIGTNNIVKKGLFLNGTKLRRLAVCFTCLPFFPCLSLYPILNGVLDCCINKVNKK